jgi:hypothetical protein
MIRLAAVVLFARYPERRTVNMKSAFVSTNHGSVNLQVLCNILLGFVT